MADHRSAAPLDRLVASSLHQTADRIPLPDQFQSPSASVVMEIERQRKRKGRVLGTVVAVLVTMTTTGLALAAQGVWPWHSDAPPSDAIAEMARQAVEEDAKSLREEVQAAESASSEIGELTLSEPVSPARVSDWFGQRQRPSGKVTDMHTGVDFYANEGDAVYAAADGIVTAAGSYPALGNVVVITHGKVKGAPVSTWYAHTGELKVKVGQQIHGGDLIALAGYTGAVTGPHLHFEVRISGDPVDPLVWIKQ